MEFPVEAQLQYTKIRLTDTLRLWYFESESKIIFDVEKSIYRVKDGGKEIATMLLEGTFKIPLPDIFSGGRKKYDLGYLIKYIMDRIK